MRHKHLLKIGIPIALMLLLVFLTFTVSGSNNFFKKAYKGYGVDLQIHNDSSMAVEFKLGKVNITNVTVDGATFSQIDFKGGVLTSKKGYAELPFLHTSIQLAPDKNFSLTVDAAHYVDYKLDYPLVPSKGVIYRNQNPESIPYVIDPASVVDSWYPGALATNSEPYIFRDVRGTNIYAYPFQYNAVTKTLRVYTDMTVRLVQDTTQAINPLRKVNSKVTTEMDEVYKSMFINYGSASSTNNILTWTNERPEMGDILVIYTSRDATAIQPYITWKREKGFKVFTTQVATGTNVKSTIQTQYNSNNNILYVQLVGDWADIKSDLGTSESAPMDPMLGCVVGSDNYPDLAIGRFPAASATEVTNMINKAINYEKTPDLAGTWYSSGLGIGSGEGAGSGDDGEADYSHIDVIKENKLIPYTYTNVTEAYQSPAKSVLTNAINAGVSIINYCGHGNETGWGTASFTNTDVYALTNGSKLPVIISVACLVGKFSYSSECFGEAWLRKTNGGAVTVLMSTILQPWQPPMRGQDYFNDLLIGGYNYATLPGDGTSTTSGRTTFGSIAINAFALMYAESSGAEDLDTIETWTTLGDSSLQVRTATPKAISISNQTVSAGVPFTTRVTYSGTGVANALVSLSQGTTVCSGFTNSNGDVTINHTLTSGAAKLVVTGLNLETKYIDITVGGTSPTPTPTVTPTPTPTPTPGGSTTITEPFTGKISTSGSSVYYYIDVTAAGTISLSMTWSGTADLDLYLYNPSGTQVASGLSTTQPETLTYNATTTGRYKIEAYAYSGTTTDFRLNATHKIDTSKTLDLSTNDSVASGAYKEYNIYPAAAGTINVFVSWTGTADLDLYLYNSGGTQVASATSSNLNPECISYTISAGGTYKVRVKSYSGAISYTVRWVHPK